ANQRQVIEPAPRSEINIESPAQTRLRQRYEAIHDLAASGLGVKTIARDLNLARGTVRRYLRAATVDDLVGLCCVNPLEPVEDSVMRPDPPGRGSLIARSRSVSARRRRSAGGGGCRSR